MRYILLGRRREIEMDRIEDWMEWGQIDSEMIESMELNQNEWEFRRLYDQTVSALVFPLCNLKVSLIFRNDNDRRLPLLRRRGVGVKASLILRIDCLIASGSSDSNALIMLF